MTEEIFALRNYAHLGDAVWEIFVREYVIYKTSARTASNESDAVVCGTATIGKQKCCILFQKI